MAYTRAWTRQEEALLRRLYGGNTKLAAVVARKLHRTPFAVRYHWQRLHRDATRQRKYREGTHGLLPAGVPARDPHGIHCFGCAQDRTFLTEEGRLYARCGCGIVPVAVRRP